MSIVIVKNSSVPNPGIYKLSNRQKSFAQHWKAAMKEGLKLGNLLNAIIHPIEQTKKDIENSALTRWKTDKIFDIQPVSITTDFGDIRMEKLYSKSKILGKGELEKSGIRYNNELFEGYFTSEVHYVKCLELLSGNDAKIIIVSINDVNDMLTQKIDSAGIYVVGKQKDLTIHPLNDFSVSNWDYLKKSFIKVFSLLGAKQIKIIDNTEEQSDSSLTLDKSLKQLSVELGFSIHRKMKFELEVEFDKSVFNPLLASEHLFKLQQFPDLHAIAEHIIRTEQKVNISRMINVDIGFGSNINVLNYLQGSFSGGSSRTLMTEVRY